MAQLRHDRESRNQRDPWPREPSLQREPLLPREPPLLGLPDPAGLQRDANVTPCLIWHPIPLIPTRTQIQIQILTVTSIANKVAVKFVLAATMGSKPHTAVAALYLQTS